MALYHYLVVAFIWSFYAVYCYMQYSEKFKTGHIFLVVALSYSLIASLLWVYLSKQLNPEKTLNYALLWDGGAHLVAFTVPILVFGDKLKTHTAIGMTLIFAGICIVLFYEKVVGG